MTPTPSTTPTRALLAAAALATSLALVACGEDAPAAPAPEEASTGVPLGEGSEDPVATSTEAVP